MDIIKMSHFTTVLLHVTRTQNSGKIKDIAVKKNKEKPLLILLMTIKLIVTQIQFRVLCTWEKEERGFNRIWQGENNAYYRSTMQPFK